MKNVYFYFYLFHVLFNYKSSILQMFVVVGVLVDTLPPHRKKGNA